MDQIKYQIANGSLKEGDRLPSVRDLARQLPVNQNTVLKAYDLLARDGLVSVRQGDGTFVASVPSMFTKSQRIKELSGLLAQTGGYLLGRGCGGDGVASLSGLDRRLSGPG